MVTAALASLAAVPLAAHLASAGLAALGRDMAEDVASTKLVRAQGLRVHLPARLSAQPVGQRAVRAVWDRQLRWSRVRRDGFPNLFLAGASISLRGKAPLGWRALGLDCFSGERVIPHAVLAERLEALDRLPRFGLEVFMNNVWLDAGFAIAVLPWPEVASPMKSPMKSDKRGGAIAGLKADNAMMADIFKTIPPVAALGQIRAMRARRI